MTWIMSEVDVTLEENNNRRRSLSLSLPAPATGRTPTPPFATRRVETEGKGESGEAITAGS